MQSSVSSIAVICVVFLSVGVAVCAESVQDADTSRECAACATNPSSCRPQGDVITYCGQGGVTNLLNRTVNVSMCCTYYTGDYISNRTNPWTCQAFSGRDSIGRAVTGGYQCTRPDPDTTALKLTLLTVVLLVVFVCVSPCVLICLCCYCCGRCRRRRESVPTALIGVTPSWMLQASPPASQSYYQMT